MENMVAKDKEMLAGNGLSPYQEYFGWILHPDFFTKP
jgi:hypothetical protein